MSTAERRRESERSSTVVAPLLPLALLESIRAHDRPREVLEDENLAASLPRRLGLTGVVESQIRRYEEADRKGRSVPLDEVRDLLRLVLRRPDAAPILRDAGTRLAQGHRRRVSSAAVSVFGVLPGVTAAAARRAARSLLRRIGASKVEVSGWPMEVRLRGGIAPGLEEAGTACTLYSAALEELLTPYLRERPALQHHRCQAYGEEWCVWSWVEG
mgnify:CR=1 FL=1